MSITSREMHAFELNAEYFDVSRLQLMENAGRAVSDEILSRFKPNEVRIVIFCGLGGNGGDGFVTTRHLICQGFKVEIVLAGKSADIADKEAKKNLDALLSLKDFLTIHEIYDSSLIPKLKADVVVDALLGIGLKGAPRPPIQQLIKKINEMRSFCIAVDAPTGINSDTGDVLGEAVKANLTITFHKTKPGISKAEQYSGEVIVKDIGLPKELERFSGPGDVQLVVKPRLPEAHKGDFGRLLVIGGSDVFSGAPTLVALAALRTGADLVHIAAPSKTAQAISSISPDLITIKLEGEQLNPRNIAIIRPYLEKVTAVVLGVGLGLHRDTQNAVKEIIKIVEEMKIPMLLDADGLKAFAQFKRRLASPLVLTPHAGEYQILTGTEPPKALPERIADVKKTAQALGAIILLKGHTDVISDGERVKLNFTGNAGMTVGGTGDVLAGVVAGFMAQGADAFEAATAGAFINGAAGDFAARQKGHHMVATDLIKWIPYVIDNPMSHLKVRKIV